MRNATTALGTNPFPFVHVSDVTSKNRLVVFILWTFPFSFSESQRNSATKPWVARERATQGAHGTDFRPQPGCAKPVIITSYASLATRRPAPLSPRDSLDQS